MAGATGTTSLFIVGNVGTPADVLVDALGRGSGEDGAKVVPLAGYVRDVPALAAGFERARFVFLARDHDEQTAGVLAELAPEQWLRVDRPQLIEDPRGELERVCRFARIVYDQALLTPVEELRRREATDARSSSPFASQSTASFAQLIESAASTLVITTYQTNRVVLVRAAGGTLNTHFRAFDKPMGVAVAPGRIALGTRHEVWDLRDMPEAAVKIGEPGSHDACYLARNRHVTGDIAVHDMAFAQGELWLVATAFSCLATLDADHSFVPRWTPRFITQLAPEDRCHLNGLAVVDDRVAYVTALGTTDAAGGWREHKADGGVLIDVGSGETAVAGLSMPHSPRWHQGRLWLLESGRGTLAVADPASGSVQTVAELPGFARGLTFAGDYALVGLSQIRESSTFGDLPVTERLRERQCGVWIVDTHAGEIAGFLRFEDLVQEIFDVAFLPGTRYPELAEPDGHTTSLSFALP
jgi:uncharacterized protein (TIGR03032 family)